MIVLRVLLGISQSAVFPGLSYLISTVGVLFNSRLCSKIHEVNLGLTTCSGIPEKSNSSDMRSSNLAK
jgi:hypothetical protein